MTELISDEKLKRFLELSLQGNQIRNATSVVYMLISNKVDEIGYNLGIIPRRKDANESLSEYMSLINKVFHLNFELEMFPESWITSIKVVEMLFERKLAHEEFPRTYLKELTQVYFELTNLKIPNLHNHLKEQDLLENRTVSLMSFLSGKHSGEDKNPVKPLLLHKVRQDQQRIKANLQSTMNQEDLIKLLQLKSLERSLLSSSKKKKIHISGNLQDSMDYSMVALSSGQYGLLGIMLLFMMITFVSIVQMLFVGFVTAEMGGIVLICVIMIVVFFYMRKKLYQFNR